MLFSRSSVPALDPIILDVVRAAKTTAHAHASTLLAEAFRANRLTPSDRRDISRAVYSMLRRHRTLALLANTDLARLTALRALAANDPATLAQLATSLSRITSPIDRLAASASLPPWLADQLLTAYGPNEGASLAHALSEAPPTTLRTNTLKITREALATRLSREGIPTRPGLHSPSALHVEDGAYDLYSTPSFRDGYFEVQDEGSQLLAEVVAPPPGSTVIDVCAGEGGKTLAIACLLANRGRVISTDIHPAKLEVTKKRARRAGATNVRTIPLEPDGSLPGAVTALTGKCARVFVDAPCSGTGSLRRNPEARERGDLADIERLSRIQLAIVERVAPLVAPGGRLVYSTCSILPQENEAIARAIGEAHPDWQPMRVVEIWGKERAMPLCDPTGTYLMPRPHRHGTDGFFAAIWRRAR